MTRIPRTLLQAALCIVAVELHYSTARNLSREKLARVLRNKLPGHEDLAYEILEELVRRGYLTKHQAWRKKNIHVNTLRQDKGVIHVQR